MYGDDDQKGRLLQLEAELSGRGPQGAPIKVDARTAAQMERQATVDKARLAQGTHMDGARNVVISTHLTKDTECRLCRHLQDDVRYLLNPILNQQELMRKDLLIIKQKLEQIEFEPNDNDVSPWWWWCCCPGWSFNHT